MEQSNNGVARVLALQREAAATALALDEEACKLVIFELGGERFAFRGEQVREILPIGQVFFVPGCPPWLEGVINVRGDIESVINLFTFLGKAAPPDGAEASILLGRSAAMRSGIRVGAVLEVLDVAVSRIVPPHAAVPEHLQRFLAGVLGYQDGVVLVLDLEPMFADCASTLA
jgi:purine-binding chemotaxis protein CheW